MIDVIIDENNINGEAIALDGETKVGEMTYDYMDTSKININHTWINPEYRGKGIAKLLLNKVIEMVRENNLKVSTTCTYVMAEFSKSDLYNDVKAKY